jgi:phosphatidylserine/phosphatidylglycerophosphate/cardiolipin synthase-like enzyme
VLLASENFGYDGFDPAASFGNRGWGVIIYDPTVAGEFSGVFSSDFSSSVPYACGTEGVAYERKEKGAYTPRFESATYDNQEVSVVFSPDSLDEILSLIESANESIDIEQLYVYTHWGSPSRDTVESAPSPLLDALFRKAREGVWVRMLMDSSYYNMEDDSTSNNNTARYVSCIAESESIPIEAGLIDLDGKGIKALHNKGVIVDGRKVLVSSINWNENSVMRNREAGLIIEGEAASFYQPVFDSDWGNAQKVACNGSASRIPEPSQPQESGTDIAWWAIQAAAWTALILSGVIYLRKRK